MSERRSFPFKPSSVPQARRFVAARLGSLPDAIGESVLLIVSELATNAIRHASTGFTLDIEQNANEVRISVTDSGDGQPAVETPRPTDLSGRGLRIVEMLSDQWGVIPATPKRGKAVWFSIKVREANRRLQEA